jgi:hypothetical protein
MSKSKQGTVPKGIVTSQEYSTVPKVEPKKQLTEKNFMNAIMSSNPKAIPKKPEGSGRYLFDAPTTSEAPRNVYRETVHLISGETHEYVWWHCENGNYIGRKEVTRIDPKTERKYLLGHDFNILATKENLKKVVELSTGVTNFVKKYRNDRRSITKEEFLKSL